MIKDLSELKQYKRFFSDSDVQEFFPEKENRNIVLNLYSENPNEQDITDLIQVVRDLKRELERQGLTEEDFKGGII